VINIADRGFITGEEIRRFWKRASAGEFAQAGATALTHEEASDSKNKTNP
jgi:hypothetical protein